MKANIRIDMRKQYFPSLAAPNQSEHKVALDDMLFYYHKDKHFNLFQGYSVQSHLVHFMDFWSLKFM